MFAFECEFCTYNVVIFSFVYEIVMSWVWGFKCCIRSSGFRFGVSEFWVLGSGFWVRCSGFWVLSSGLWFRLMFFIPCSLPAWRLLADRFDIKFQSSIRRRIFQPIDPIIIFYFLIIIGYYSYFTTLVNFILLQSANFHCSQSRYPIR